MENLDYLEAKSQSKQNKNLDVLPVFFTDEELDTLSKKSISIVGTNGKTSTANHIFQYLQDIDVNPCRFTSPHLVKVNERIQSNNGFIWDRDIDKYLNEIRKFEAKEKVVLGYFETLFLISCKYFLDMNLDIFIVEAGIGGRLDTTSIINSENVALTNIGYDHTEILGETLEEILIEKIKISNKVKNFFIGDVSTHRKYEKLIREELGLTDNTYFAPRSFHLKEVSEFSIDSNFLEANRELAFEVFHFLLLERSSERYFLSDEQVEKYLAREGHELEDGRFDFIYLNGNKFKLVDGAHNSSAIYSLFNTLESALQQDLPRKIECIIGLKKGKDYKGIVDQLVTRDYLDISLIQDQTFTDQMDPEIIARYLKELGREIKYMSIEDFESYNNPSILLGSLYLVGEYKKYIKGVR